MPRNYSGQTLKGRPFKPEDDLEGADFTEAILQDVVFKDLNLTNAIFVKADIRGANFRNAILSGADFSGATAGLSVAWALSLLLMACSVSIILNLVEFLINGSLLANTPDRIRG